MLTDDERETMLRRLDSVRAELSSMSLPREERQRILLSEQERLRAALEKDDEERRQAG